MYFCYVEDLRVVCVCVCCLFKFCVLILILICFDVVGVLVVMFCLFGKGIIININIVGVSIIKL